MRVIGLSLGGGEQDQHGVSTGRFVRGPPNQFLADSVPLVIRVDSKV